MASPQQLINKLTKALYLGPALRMVWSSSPRWTIARIGLLVIQGVLPLCSLYLTKLIIDTLTLGLTTQPAAVGQRLLLLLVLVGVVTLISDFCTFLADLVNTAQSHRVEDTMSDLIQAKSIEMDLGYYETPQYLDTLKRAQSEASYRPNQVLQRLVAVAQQSIALSAMMVLLLSLHWGIAGILLLAAIPSVLVKVNYANRLFTWHRQKTVIDRQADYINWMLTSVLFAKEVRLFNLGELFRGRFQKLRQELWQGEVSIATSRSIAGLGAQVISSAMILAAYAFIVNQTLQGVLKIGDLFLYYQAFERGQSSLKSVLTSLSGLYEDNLFLANLYDFLNLKSTVAEPKSPQVFPCPMQSGIVFANVCFQYASSNRQSLHNINLSIAPGEVIALVGENGCGKTTLIKLLGRLYDPTSGAVSIDGINLKEFNTADWRRQMSVIFQDYAKYNLTALENIGLGNIELPQTIESVTAAAQRAGADRVVASLPAGYETVLGALFDDGEELSIGQWQKIALARAFLRNSQLIVLDEPTSAMDPKAEYDVFQKFRQLITHQSAILISHRLSTVKMADRIYVMDKGCIIEQGTHDALMKQQGVYTDLFETQAAPYR
jgi:ATP-binding cassette, subfamily B, bacterial